MYSVHQKGALPLQASQLAQDESISAAVTSISQKRQRINDITESSNKIPRLINISTMGIKSPSDGVSMLSGSLKPFPLMALPEEILGCVREGIVKYLSIKDAVSLKMTSKHFYSHRELAIKHQAGKIISQCIERAQEAIVRMESEPDKLVMLMELSKFEAHLNFFSLAKNTARMLIGSGEPSYVISSLQAIVQAMVLVGKFDEACTLVDEFQDKFQNKSTDPNMLFVDLGYMIAKACNFEKASEVAIKVTKNDEQSNLFAFISQGQADKGQFNQAKITAQKISNKIERFEVSHYIVELESAWKSRAESASSTSLEIENQASEPSMVNQAVTDESKITTLVNVGKFEQAQTIALSLEDDERQFKALIQIIKAKVSMGGSMLKNALLMLQDHVGEEYMLEAYTEIAKVMVRCGQINTAFQIIHQKIQNHDDDLEVSVYKEMIKTCSEGKHLEYVMKLCYLLGYRVPGSNQMRAEVFLEAANRMSQLSNSRHFSRQDLQKAIDIGERIRLECPRFVNAPG